MTNTGNVWDFLSPQEIAAVRARTYTIDVAAKVQLCIDSVAAYADVRPMAVVTVPAGGYVIGTQLRVPSSVTVVGAGQGRSESSTVAGTNLAWYGNADDMIVFGGNGAGLTAGGGISSLRIDGRSIAANCLTVRDAVSFDLSKLEIANGVKAALLLTNTATQGYPSGRSTCSQINVYQRGGQTQAGHGIMIHAPWATGVAGTTLMLWDQIQVQHADGAGIYVLGGDAHQWNRLFTFRAEAEIGPGVHFANTDPNITDGGHVFVDPVVGGGFRFDHPGTIAGIRIINADDYNLAPRTKVFSGIGASSASATTQSGRRFGDEKTLSYRETISHDAMKFVSWANNVLHTSSGSWGTSAAYVGDAWQPGGAVEVTNSGSPGDTASIYDCAVPGRSGLSTGYEPVLIFTVGVLDNVNTAHRWGFLDSVARPPANGIWVEADPHIDRLAYRLVCRRAGVETSINAPGMVCGPGQITSWRIHVQRDSVSFFGRFGSDTPYAYLGTITENVPDTTAKLDTVFQVTGLDHVARNTFVYDRKIGFSTE